MNNVFKQIKRFEGYDFTDNAEFHIILPAKVKEHQVTLTEVLETTPLKMEVSKEYKITVKQYMTEISSPTFDFMEKWNNNIPMPLVTMTGTVIKETRGMVYMKLHGVAEPSCTCFVCGRTLTNPVSKLYGIGPECGDKVGLMRIATEEEARKELDDIKSHLVDIKWEGWVIRSSIKSWEAVA